MGASISLENKTFQANSIYKDRAILDPKKIGGPFFISENISFNLRDSPKSSVTIKINGGDGKNSIRNESSVTGLSEVGRVNIYGIGKDNKTPIDFPVEVRISIEVPAGEKPLTIKKLLIDGVLASKSFPPLASPATPIGFSYMSNNKNVNTTMEATQKVISAIQTIGCQEVVPQMIYNIQNAPMDKKYGNLNPEEIKKAYVVQVDAFINQMNVKKNIREESINILRSSLINLSNICIDNATMDGKVNQELSRKLLIDILTSFCPGNLLGRYKPPVEEIIAEKTQSTLSTFGDMSSFGATCNCMIWIALLVLVLAVAGYILYTNRGNIKMPSLPQRIARFGRQIKAIRKM